MSTQTKIKKTLLEKNWEIKDRTYLLTRDMSPVTYTIQTKHTSRKPLLWFDPEMEINREIRLASNQKSLFVDEQDGYVTLTHVIFEDGILSVNKEDVLKQKLLSLYHPLKGQLWEEIDEQQVAEDEVDILEYQLEALNLVNELDISHIEAIMRTELGSSVSTLTSKELKRDAYRFAKQDPALFIELSEDEDITLRNLANRAVETGVIMLTDDNTVFKFANGKKIMAVPFDQHPYAALAQYFKTDDGVDLMKSLSKKLN
tara:strand:- start:137 stop:910 length:774 start_codon:yes stop_codon:yes gene_type:complete